MKYTLLVGYLSKKGFLLGYVFLFIGPDILIYTKILHETHLFLSQVQEQ